MGVWSWMCELPNSDEWASESPLIYELASSGPISPDKPAQSIQLRAERTAGSNSDALVVFSVCLRGFVQSSATLKTLWVSDACPLSSDKPFLPLILQLLQETLSRAPTTYDSTCPRSQLQKLRPDPISWILETHSPESFSCFFNFVFLTRLFWLCVCDAPNEVGSLYFQGLLAPNLEAFTCDRTPVLRAFLVSVGVDAELCFMRTLGYILAKWLILREVGAGLLSLTPQPSQKLGLSYAYEANGVWVLKGYAPLLAMRRTRFSGQKNEFPIVDAKESVLRYALAHQQLEAVIQLEYSVEFCDGYIQVNASVDNLRLHVAKLGFLKNENDNDFADERHFPSRVRVWIGPEIGSTFVSSMSLGRSTKNIERGVETQKLVKGNFGKLKAPKVTAMARTTTRTQVKNWRWDQDVEGSAGVFDAVMYDNTTGLEVATWELASNEDDDHKSGNSLRNRCMNWNRPFTKSGNVIFASDEYDEKVRWRLSKEMEGSVLKWRIGGQIWVTYWPTNVKSSYYETRCVEWCDEVDLPLIPSN